MLTGKLAQLPKNLYQPSERSLHLDAKEKWLKGNTSIKEVGIALISRREVGINEKSSTKS